MTPAEFRAIRENVNLNQGQLGEILDLTYTHISRIENGAPLKKSIELAMRAIAILGLPDQWPYPPNKGDLK